MAENAIQHSHSQTAALVGYEVTDGVSQFCVVDVGIGVLKSLTECKESRSLRSTHRRSKRRCKMVFRDTVRVAVASGFAVFQSVHFLLGGTSISEWCRVPCHGRKRPNIRLWNRVLPPFSSRLSGFGLLSKQ